jgi:hypothetical protein
MKGYTGPYRYKDSDPDPIDTVPRFQKADLKTFKQAVDVDSLWLTKQNPVRQQTDEPYQRFKGKEVR